MTKPTRRVNWGDTVPEDRQLPIINRTSQGASRKITTNHHIGIKVEQIAFSPDTYIVSTDDDVEYTVTEGADQVLEVTIKSDGTNKRSNRTVIRAVEQYRKLAKN